MKYLLLLFSVFAFGQAPNEMVSFTQAAGLGFFLKPGQSHVTSLKCMTKLEAVTKYYLEPGPLAGYADNQLIPRSAWLGILCLPGPTAVVNVTSPTGRIWMDRNLGAFQAATSMSDLASYGDLYQWGRGTDGGQCRNSTQVPSYTGFPTDSPGNIFIQASDAPNSDWRNPQNNNLWQGVNGINNPCPSGYRLPTAAELSAEIAQFSPQNTTGAFNSVLKLPASGNRGSTGDIIDFGNAQYWTSTVNGINAQGAYSYSTGIYISSFPRFNGFAVRCIKN
ncbi:MAG TPA: hypothetical protein VF677_11660 [Flavobacterium sp.]|jgi:hypothetical protein